MAKRCHQYTCFYGSELFKKQAIYNLMFSLGGIYVCESTTFLGIGT